MSEAVGSPIASFAAGRFLRYQRLGRHLASVVVIVRRERTIDQAAARAVQATAFDNGDGEPAEARLLDDLRGCDGWIPALSWVVEIDGRVVGHNVCTRGHVGNVPCVGLGPIGVEPDAQRAGIGSALMHAMIGAADASGEPLIALLGDPAYYSRFGFITSTEIGVEAPDPAWAVHFQVLPLSNWTDTITGTFRYASPFDEIG